MNRRNFLKGSAIVGSTLPFITQNKLWAASQEDEIEKLVLLHTNDTHSRIDPFESGDYRGLGGVSVRKTIIDDIRKSEKNVLLLDAGDIFQGTPYFNMFQGELEMKAMSMIGYDVGTMGNHDFDMGMENFAKQQIFANFPFVVSNYLTADTPLHNIIKPYHILNKGHLKIGILGCGLDLEGYVPKEFTKNLIIANPILEAQETANVLKYDYKCNIVIALSHLGYSYSDKKIFSDLQLAKSVNNIDIIIGGHTHTFLPKPKFIMKGEENFVIVNQVGFGGINVGEIDIYYSHVSKKITSTSTNLLKCQTNL